MEGLLIFLVVIVVIIALLFVFKCFYIVKQQETYIIETLGKFSAIKGPGFHVKLPTPIQSIAAKMSLKTLQTDQVLDAKTKDNVTVSLSVAVQYCVAQYPGQSPRESGIYRAYYMLSNPIAQMNAYIADAVRSSVPSYTLDELFESKEEIAHDTGKQVGNIMMGNGYQIFQVLITNIELPASVEKSMNDINAAQRQRQAAQDLAEAEKIKRVTEAQAEAEAMQKTGQGIANQRIAIAKGIKESLDTIQESGVSEAEANELFLYTQWVEMMQSFAESGTSSTVVLPADFTESRSMFTQMLAAQSTTAQSSQGYHRVDLSKMPQQPRQQ